MSLAVGGGRKIDMRTLAKPIVGDIQAAADNAGTTPRKTPIALVALACFASVCGYACWTGHVWEDFFITFRHSRNLVEGRGLTYNPPERIHGFTSPVGVLLPALCDLATGVRDWRAALWLFRLLSALAFAGAGALAALLLLRGRRAGWLIAAWAVLYAFEAKAVAYSANGMETAWLLLPLAGTLVLTAGEPGRGWLLGLCWAGLLWARPDGFIWAAGLALGRLLLTPGRRAWLGCCLRSLAICLVLYGPWLAFTWAYYGSPIPHTVIAKANVEWGPAVQLREAYDNLDTRFPRATAEAFQPVLFWGGKDWLPWVHATRLLVAISEWLGFFAALYWLLPVNDRAGRLASFGFAVGCLYLASIYSVCSWYWPPATVLGLFALVRAGQTVLAPPPGGTVSPASSWQWTAGWALVCYAFFTGVYPVEPWYAPTAAILATAWLPRVPALMGRFPWRLVRVPAGAAAAVALAAVALAQLTVFGLTAYEMKVQQAEVEDGNRIPVGLWLRDHVGPAERIYLEPLGYVGFFCGRHVVDWPGLVSPDVVRARRQKRTDYWSMIGEVRPDWVVLRDGVPPVGYEPAAFLHANYKRVATFDVRDNLKRYAWLPGRSYLFFDSCFHVYKRVPDVRAGGAAPGQVVQNESGG